MSYNDDEELKIDLGEDDPLDLDADLDDTIDDEELMPLDEDDELGEGLAGLDGSEY